MYCIQLLSFKLNKFNHWAIRSHADFLISREIIKVKKKNKLESNYV
jgi:hypothetical protein